jgi:hypothetical protein
MSDQASLELLAFCKACGAPRPTEGPEVKARCAACGQTEMRDLHLRVPFPFVRIELRDAERPGRPFAQLKRTRTLQRDTGQDATHDRSVDRSGDWYDELVWTGGITRTRYTPQYELDEPEWLYVCQEPLSEHQGHGDARDREPSAG